MSTIETETEAAEETAQSQSPYAFLFELETLAVAGRNAAYEVLSSLLTGKKVELSQTLFARFGLHPSPAHYLPGLLSAAGAGKLSVDKLAREVESGMALYFSSNEAVLNTGFDQLLSAMLDKDISAGALSSLPEEQGAALMKKLGLDERGVELFSCDAGKHVFPRADTWMKVVKSSGRSPRNCLALVSSHDSCKSALSAGIHCVAMPDAFTAFEDFGGADLVADSYGDLDVKDLLDHCFPAL